LAALPADWKVAVASFAVMATVVSMLDRLPPAGGRKYCGRSGFLIGEFADGHPVMMTEGQVPPDQLASYALEQLCNGVLTIFRLGQHAFDSV
jgi:hypothetical protein